jgi:hypothetical protein
MLYNALTTSIILCDTLNSFSCSPINIYMCVLNSSTMILLLRGHIRNSFKDDRLYLLLKDLERCCPHLVIYIHTWNVLQSDVSWRKLDAIDTAVTEELVLDYLRDLRKNVKGVLIDDDRYIKLIGNVEGNVRGTTCPLLGWKRYWYGKFRLINHISEHVPKYSVVLNMRFDIMSCSYSFTHELVMAFIVKNNDREFTKNAFMFDFEKLGIDNAYVGNMETMKKLVEHFYYNLDDITMHKRTMHQEVLVFRENDILFPETSVTANRLRLTA